MPGKGVRYAEPNLPIRLLHGARRPPHPGREGVLNGHPDAGGAGVAPWAQGQRHADVEGEAARRGAVQLLAQPLQLSAYRARRPERPGVVERSYLLGVIEMPQEVAGGVRLWDLSRREAPKPAR